MRDEHQQHFPIAALLGRIEVDISEQEILADLAYPAEVPLGDWGRDRPVSALDRVNGHGGRSRSHPRRRATATAR